jgi:hypothetical protein
VAAIGQERAALAFTSILTAATVEQAEARLTLVLDYGNTEPVGEAAPEAGEPKAATFAVFGKRQAILDQVQNGLLPQPRVSLSPPMHGSAPSWRRLPLWPKRATLWPCRPSKSIRFRRAPRLWCATATFV